MFVFPSRDDIGEAKRPKSEPKHSRYENILSDTGIGWLGEALGSQLRKVQ